MIKYFVDKNGNDKKHTGKVAIKFKFTYEDIAKATGLSVSTIRNYRSR